VHQSKKTYRQEERELKKSRSTAPKAKNEQDEDSCNDTIVSRKRDRVGEYVTKGRGEKKKEIFDSTAMGNKRQWGIPHRRSGRARWVVSSANANSSFRLSFLVVSTPVPPYTALRRKAMVPSRRRRVLGRSVV
jgi:hypothetical protein